MSSRLRLALSLFALAACGRSALESPRVSSPESDGGSGPTSTASVTSSVSSGTGGGACGNETHDSASVRIDQFAGPTFGCTAGPQGTFTQSMLGSIVSASNGVIAIDGCSPAEDCAGTQITTITIHAPSVNAAFLPLGAYVEVRLRESADSFHCTDTLMIKNLPSWAGAPNPVAAGDAVWLVATNAGDTFDDAGYEVETVPLHCYPPSSDCGPKDDDVFRVTVSSQSVDVAMGTTTEVGAPNWIFKNLSSYTTGLCDDPPHFAYLLFVPMLD